MPGTRSRQMDPARAPELSDAQGPDAPETPQARARCGGCGLATSELVRDPGHVDWLVQNEPQWLCPSCERTRQPITGRDVLAALIFIGVIWYSVADIARWAWLTLSAGF